MPDRRLIAWGLGIGVLLVAAYGAWSAAMRPVLQAVDSPDSRHTARLFRLYNEGGPAPYGSEVAFSSAGNPLGRFSGTTLWIGYCEGGSLSWKSASDIELTCPPHPDGKDVSLAKDDKGVHLRVVRLR
jgi:hypothetical protein